MEELREITGKEDVHFLKLDLGDIKASKSAAEELVNKEPKLNSLVNNAGEGLKKEDLKTDDGHEIQ